MLANELLPAGQLGSAYRARLLLTHRHFATEIREALLPLTLQVRGVEKALHRSSHLSPSPRM